MSEVVIQQQAVTVTLPTPEDLHVQVQPEAVAVVVEEPSAVSVVIHPPSLRVQIQELLITQAGQVAGYFNKWF